MESPTDNNKYGISRFNLLTSLLAILNRNSENDTDFVIARYFLSHINTIENTSIYTIADECFVSRSSVQRFIKNIGYDSYTQLKDYLKDVITHENALIDYTDHTDYTDFLLENIHDMCEDIAHCSKTADFQKLVSYFVKARNIVILTAEDSSQACRLFQQQILASGVLIRIITSASSNISLLDSLEKEDLLLVCSVTGNFALAINDQIRNNKATRCLLTLNKTTAFEGNYSLIYYIGKDIMISSRNIMMSKNVYTTYGLTFFFDLFYHGCYVEYNRIKNKGQ